MRAIVITDEAGGAHGIKLREVNAPPSPTSDRVRVRVRTAGVNRADLHQRAGKYPAPPGYPVDIPGLEFAGEVEAIGEDVRRWKVGERVCGITAGGAQADLVVVAESNLTRIPDELSYEEAGALPEAFITAHDALFTLGQLGMGERVLIHAAASGVGTAAVQLAHAAGAFVYGTSRTAEKLDRMSELGLDEAILVKDEPERFADEVERLTDGAGVNVIIDLVGGAYFPVNLRALALRGRIVSVGTTAGAKAAINLGLLMRRRGSVTGTVLRARSVEEKAAAVSAFAEQVLPLIAGGRIRPVIDRMFPAAEILAAHEHVESNGTFGKVLLDFS